MDDFYFVGHYDDWREKRIAKLVSILGDGWLSGKRVLELACGKGHVGGRLARLGASVTFADGRECHLAGIGGRKMVIDQDGPWSIGERFDLVVHWGVLYHLKNWEQDLECALRHSDLMCLESEVLDSASANVGAVIKESGYDQSIHGVGVRPSAVAIERRLEGLGASFVRYDDADLDSGEHVYSWEARDSGRYKPGLRRFWMVRRPLPIP